MSNSKLNVFVNRLVDILGDTDRTTVKSLIGDSTANNRTITVNQLVRYLEVTGYYTTASNVRKLQRNLSGRLNSYRTRNNNRTDAFDVNELLTVLTNVATRGAPSTKQALSRVISI